MKITFKKNEIKEINNCLKVLSGKDAKLFIATDDKANEDKILVSFVNVEDRSQHIFKKVADKPADFDEGYLSICVKTANFLKILSVFEGFESDVSIADEGGKYYISAAGKAKTLLEVIAITEEDRKSFIKPVKENQMVKCEVAAATLASLIRKGSCCINKDKVSNGTENVLFKFNKEELLVSSIDGNRTSVASAKVKNTFKEGLNEFSVCIGEKGIKQLNAVIAGAKAIGMQVEEKNAFIFTDSRECLILGLAQSKAIPCEDIIKAALSGGDLAKIVIDKDEIIAGLKTVIALSEDNEAVKLTIDGEKMTISRKETEIVVKMVAAEGGEGREFYYNGTYMLELCSALDSGNLRVEIKGDDKVPKLLLRNEKGAAILLLMPVTVNSGKKEETTEKAEESKEESAE